MENAIGRASKECFVERRRVACHLAKSSPCLHQILLTFADTKKVSLGGKNERNLIFTSIYKVYYVSLFGGFLNITHRGLEMIGFSGGACIAKLELPLQALSSAVSVCEKAGRWAPWLPR